MNFNLIAPQGKTNDFTVQFKEPIEIPADSSVYLNYLTAVRDNVVDIPADTNIQFIPRQVIPSVMIDQVGLAPNERTNGASFTVVIPAGSYNNLTLQKAITDALNEKLLNNVPRANYHLDYTSAILSLSQGRTESGVGRARAKANEMIVGLRLRRSGEAHDREIYDNFSRDINNNNTADNVGVFMSFDDNKYKKLRDNNDRGANQTKYDNYALSDKHYFHFGNHPQLLSERNIFVSNTLVNRNFIEAKTLVSVQNITGGHFIGLYGIEYADGFSGDADRTTGNADINGAFFNPKCANNDLTPLIPFGVEVDMENGHALVRVYTGITSDGAQLENCIDPRLPITNVRLVAEHHLDTTHRPSDFVVIRIMTGYKKNLDNADFINGGTREFDFFMTDKLYPSVYVNNPTKSGNGNAFRRIYNGGSNGVGFNPTHFPSTYFFNDYQTSQTGTNTNDERFSRNSQVPFGVFVAIQQVNSGWRNIKFKSFHKEAGTSSNANPRTFIPSYKMIYSPALAKLFDGTAVGEPITSSIKYPIPSINYDSIVREQIKDAIPYELFENILGFLDSEDYSVYIENVPLKNFKNVLGRNVGGYSKAILANIPQIFTAEDIGSKQGILGIYQPYQKLISDLKNQNFKTNNFHITFKTMKDDKPAVNIKYLNVSFTIVPRNSSQIS